MTREELRYAPDGSLWSRGAWSYKLPGIADAPPDFRVRLLEHAAEPSVIYGSKVVGEPPLMLAISVREVLRDAVRAYRGPGAFELGCPAQPEVVFLALRA